MKLNWTSDDYRNLGAFAGKHVLRRLMLLVLFIVINPFDLSSENDRKIQEDWQAINAEYYGARHAGAGSGLDRVTVMTLTFDEERKLTPIEGVGLDTYDYAEMLRRLVNLHRISEQAMDRPRAIFLDLFFDHGVPPGGKWDAIGLVDLTAQEQVRCDAGRAPQENNPQPFSPFRCGMYEIGKLTNYKDWKDKPDCFANPVAKIACIRKYNGVPIIFAENRGALGTRSYRERNIGEAAIHRVALGVPVMTSLYDYWLAAPPSLAEREKKDFDLSPAAALYWAHCSGKSGQDPKAEDALAQPGTIEKNCAVPPVIRPNPKAEARWERSREGWNWSGAFDTAVETVWAIGITDKFTEALSDIESGTREQYCAQAQQAKQSLMLKLARRAVTGLTNAEQILDEKTNRYPCPYAHSFTLAELDLLTPPLVERGIADRLILIGRADNDADRFDVKSLGRLPGVLLHATALQNLIDSKADYPKVATRYVEAINFSDRDAASLQAAVGPIAVGGVLIYLARRRTARAARPARGRAKAALPTMARGDRIIALGTIAATLLIGAVILWLYPPVPSSLNVAVMVLAAILETWSIIAELLKPLWSNLAQRGGVWRFVFGED